MHALEFLLFIYLSFFPSFVSCLVGHCFCIRNGFAKGQMVFKADESVITVGVSITNAVALAVWLVLFAVEYYIFLVV